MSAHQHRLYHQVQLAAHELKKLADRALAHTGLTTAQVAVLAAVAEGSPLSQRAVAARLGVNESAVTAMSRRLVDLGLLAREHAEADARLRLLVLTPSGRAALTRARRSFAGVNAAADRALSAAEVATLADLLARLRAAAAGADDDVDV